MTFLGGHDDYGMNLTCSLILSTVKYPWDIDNKPDGKRKVGLFTMDKKNYDYSCEKVGWNSGDKFPFALIMEAADDISYSMSDLEDGLEKGIISVGDIRDAFGEEQVPVENSSKISPFIDFKTRVIRDVVNEASNIFVESIDDMLAGQNVNLVDSNNPSGALVEEVKKFAREKIYSDAAAEKVELAGRSVISGLLHHFGTLLDLTEEQFLFLVNEDMENLKGLGLDFEIRLMRRLPKSYRERYLSQKRGDEMLRRTHLIVDFIAGMTDDFALEMYQVLEGIRIK